MCPAATIRNVIERTVTSLAGFVRRANGRRCSQCGRGFVRSSPVLTCVGVHTLHPTCVKHAMGREVCPICGNMHFLRGPSALDINISIECARCGQRYVVVVVGRELIHAETIDYNGRWPDRGDWTI